MDEFDLSRVPSYTHKKHQDRDLGRKASPVLFLLFVIRSQGIASVLSSHSQDCSLVPAVVVAGYIPVSAHR